MCNEAKRKNYDLWKRSGVAIPFHDWQALNDSVKTVCNVFIQRHISIQRRCCKTEIQIHYWSSVCSQCTGPYELRRNPCWRLQRQNQQPHPKQAVFTLSKTHQKSVQKRLHLLQVSQIKRVRMVMESLASFLIVLSAQTQTANMNDMKK